ncbi:hopanoid biosynthesis associated protein HpnK [Rhizobiales bacterium GAS191]|nr:hopanoid biosynthesis associated protein HpnK [Rhizobiales bacterium GAS188]SED15753.1 hopanoid biosynthesis associated protein HpnK [Rhizobiales bacterium GAS191]
MKQLIVTADDFGLATEVNDAVEKAHTDGILSAASLMVGASASADAVSCARRMPDLRVGLHLTLVEGRPVLPAAEIPDLVDKTGRLRNDLAAYGVAIMAMPSVRRQLRAEIRAQFEAYRATGLTLDHVNAHRHYHLHPTVLSEILAIGVDYGMRALRVPVEPMSLLRAVEPKRRGPAAMIAAPWAARMLRRVKMSGLVTTDRVFGLAWSGAMTEGRVAGLLERLPLGRTEIYTHPATSGDYEGAARGYRYNDEFAALMSRRCREAMQRSGAVVGGYGDLKDVG